MDIRLKIPATRPKGIVPRVYHKPLSQLELEVLAALKRLAGPDGKVQVDKHVLARETGEDASRCSAARAELVRKKVVRKIGWSRPMLIDVSGVA